MQQTFDISVNPVNTRLCYQLLNKFNTSNNFKPAKVDKDVEFGIERSTKKKVKKLKKASNNEQIF